MVRPGHLLALDYMDSPDFLEVKALFERYPEIGGVYFRPTNGCVTVVDLHPESPKPRIGVGGNPYLPAGTRACDIEPGMERRIEWLREVRGRQVGDSREVRFEARIIREAQASRLRMPGFPERLRFLHSQWRIDPSAAGKARITDLLAVDLPTRRLVVIELKAASDPSAIDQARSYVQWFQERADSLNPFFHRLATIVGRLYGCPEMESLRDLGAPVVALAAWPDPSGPDGVTVVGREHLESGTGVVPENVRSVARTREAQAGGTGTGPQYAGDPPFRAAMRLHQSLYRAEVLGVPCGTGPDESGGRLLGNMLRPEDGARGLNFLTPAIFRFAERRAKENPRNISIFRLRNNLLSSQPLCFNLFTPLALDLDMASRLWSILYPEEIAKVTRVIVEWAPEPAADYLADNTSFDAFVEYMRPDGRYGFVGIETKLTEPFSAKRYDRPEYRRWMTDATGPWRRGTADQVADVAHNQLWRDHLLAIALRDRPGSRYAEGKLLLVHHPGDAECSRAAAGYRKLLRLGDTTFRDIHLDDLVGRWVRVASNPAEREWLEEFRRRYLPESES